MQNCKSLLDLQAKKTRSIGEKEFIQVKFLSRYFSKYFFRYVSLSWDILYKNFLKKIFFSVKNILWLFKQYNGNISKFA